MDVKERAMVNIKDFHNRIQDKAEQTQIGLENVNLLHTHLGIYERDLGNQLDEIKNCIKVAQREINRDFTGPIVRSMGLAYTVSLLLNY